MTERVTQSSETAEVLQNQMVEITTAAERVAQGGEELARISGDLQARIAMFRLEDSGTGSLELLQKN